MPIWRLPPQPQQRSVRVTRTAAIYQNILTVVSKLSIFFQIGISKKIKLSLLLLSSEISRFKSIRKISSQVQLVQIIYRKIYIKFINSNQIELLLKSKIGISIKAFILQIDTVLKILKNLSFKRILKLKELLVTTFEYLRTGKSTEKILSTIVKLSTKVRYGLVKILMSSIVLSLITEKITEFVQELLLKIDLKTKIVRKIVLSKIQISIINLVFSIRRIFKVTYIFSNQIVFIKKILRKFQKSTFKIILNLIPIKFIGKSISIKLSQLFVSTIDRIIFLRRKINLPIYLSLVSERIYEYLRMFSNSIKLVLKLTRKILMERILSQITQLLSIKKIGIRLKVRLLRINLLIRTFKQTKFVRRISNFVLLSLLSEKLVKFIQILAIKINLMSKVNRKVLFKRIQISIEKLVAIIKRIAKINFLFKNTINLITKFTRGFLKAPFDISVTLNSSDIFLSIKKSFRVTIISALKILRQFNIRRKLISIEILSIFSEKLISFIQILISSIAIRVSIRRIIKVLRTISIYELLVVKPFQKSITKIFSTTEKLYSILNRQIKIKFKISSIQTLITKKIFGLRRKFESILTLIFTVSKLKRFVRKLSARIKEISIIWYYTKVLGYKVIKFIRDRKNTKIWRKITGDYD